MIYIILTIISWILSGIMSIYFRKKELKKKTVLMHKQLVSQISVFVIFALIFKEFFQEIIIDLNFLELWWFSIYVLFSSVSYYAVQVFYEFFSGNKLFATNQEVQEYIEKIERDKL